MRIRHSLEAGTATPASGRASRQGRRTTATIRLLLLASLALDFGACGGEDTTLSPTDTARIWRATADGTGSDCGNLQDCLDTAADGDTIELGAGLYDSVGDTLAAGTCTALPQVTNGVCRKNVVVRGVAGATVVIDGRGEPGRIGITVPAELTDVTLENLTFTNCWAGIGTAGGTVKIRNCTFTLGDHGVEAHETVINVEDCTFENHLQVALNLRNCSGTIRRVSVIGSGGGMACAGRYDLTVSHAQFGPYCESGVSAYGSGNLRLVNCTIAGTAMLPGRLDTAGLLVFGTASAELDRCIVAGNRGYGVICTSAASLVLNCSDVFGNTVAPFSGCPDATGTRGNIAADPRFCGPQDYHLKADSPARLADCGVMGAHSVVCSP